MSPKIEEQAVQLHHCNHLQIKNNESHKLLWHAKTTSAIYVLIIWNLVPPYSTIYKERVEVGCNTNNVKGDNFYHARWHADDMQSDHL